MFIQAAPALGAIQDRLFRRPITLITQAVAPVNLTARLLLLKMATQLRRLHPWMARLPH